MNLRFRSIDDMPPAMRSAAVRAVNKHRANGKSECLTSMLENDAPVPVVAKPPRRSKYGAVPTMVDGIRFDSKREAAYYQRLKLRVAAGEVLYFVRQVPLHLPGGTRLVVDFLEFMADGTARWVDVKGRETPAFKIKRREIEAHYPIRILLA